MLSSFLLRVASHPCPGSQPRCCEAFEVPVPIFFFIFNLLRIFLNYISNAIPKVSHTLPPPPLPSPPIPIFLALAFPCTGAYKVYVLISCLTSSRFPFFPTSIIFECSECWFLKKIV
uniref:Uncharacterized protein n=1 Tax=Mus musculus TaxID=10090 RepID=Q3TN51_MOUSE|nr:unnamed protein product [Mus musculus]